TWDEFIEVCKKLQKPPRLTGYGMCLGLQNDTDNNAMNMIWCYGGKLVEADNKTVALYSKETIAAVQLIADMYLKNKNLPKGGDLVGQYRQQQSLSVTTGDFCLESYQHLRPSGRIRQRAVQRHRAAARAGRAGWLDRGSQHWRLRSLQA